MKELIEKEKIERKHRGSSFLVEFRMFLHLQEALPKTLLCKQESSPNVYCMKKINLTLALYARYCFTSYK